MIVDRNEIGDIEYLFGVTKDDFRELKYINHLQAYYRKIDWAKELIKKLLDEPLSERDMHRVAEVTKSIKWQRDRIAEMI